MYSIYITELFNLRVLVLPPFTDTISYLQYQVIIEGNPNVQYLKMEKMKFIVIWRECEIKYFSVPPLDVFNKNSYHCSLLPTIGK